MNAQQELVQSDRQAEVVLSDGRFVTIYKLKVWHLILSEDKDHMVRAVNLIATATTIDDAKPTIQQILNLDVEDFNKIVVHLIK